MPVGDRNGAGLENGRSDNHDDDRTSGARTSRVDVNVTKLKLNSVALVRERPPPVGEVSANFCG